MSTAPIKATFALSGHVDVTLRIDPDNLQADLESAFALIVGNGRSVDAGLRENILAAASRTIAQHYRFSVKFH